MHAEMQMLRAENDHLKKCQRGEEFMDVDNPTEITEQTQEFFRFSRASFTTEPIPLSESQSMGTAYNKATQKMLAHAKHTSSNSPLHNHNAGSIHDTFLVQPKSSSLTILSLESDVTTTIACDRSPLADITSHSMENIAPKTEEKSAHLQMYLEPVATAQQDKGAAPSATVVRVGPTNVKAVDAAMAKAETEVEAKAKARVEAVANAKATKQGEAVAKAKANAAKAEVEAAAYAKAKAEAAEAVAKARVKAKAETEAAKTKTETEAKAKAEVEAAANAKAKAEGEEAAKAKIEADAEAAA
jgi:hypothetical protein